MSVDTQASPPSRPFRNAVVGALTGQRLNVGATSLTTGLAVVVTLAIVAGVISANNASPIATVEALYKGSLDGAFPIGQTITISSILALTGLAAAIPFTARLWNIGGEGQLYFGAFCAIAIGLTIPASTPHWIFSPLVVLTSMVGGAVWAFIPGVMKATIDANEIIVTLMLTYVAIHLSTYSITTLWPQGVAPSTKDVPGNARLPIFWEGGDVNVGTILAVVAVFVAWVVMSRTSLGFSIRATGFNPNSSRMNGIDPKRITMASFAFGGAFAGLAGCILVTGVSSALITGFSSNYGFLGIAVALLARLNPALIIPAAFLFSILRVGSSSFQAEAGLDPAIGDVIVALFIILLIFFRLIRVTATPRA
jgi:general nucleoside transport system permease protein